MNIVSLCSACFVVVLVLGVYGVISYKEHNYMGNLLWRSSVAAIILVLSYTYGFLSSSETFSDAMFSISFAATGWALNYLNLFAHKYSDSMPSRAYIRIRTIILLADTVVILSNPFSHFAATYKVENDRHLGVVVQKQFFYQFHSIFCYIMLIGIIVVLMVTVIRTSEYYRIRYEVELLAVLLMIITKIIVIYSATSFDYSIFIYAIAIAFSYHCTYMFSAGGIMCAVSRIVDDNIADATITFDQNGNVLKVNDACMRIFPSDVRENYENMYKTLGNPAEGTSKIKYDDSLYEMRYETIIDSKDRKVADVFIFHDISEDERRFIREHAIATRDQLTEAYNRIGFFEAAEEFLKNNSANARYVVVACGICNFKGINSFYGIESGDFLLREISSKLCVLNRKYWMLYGRIAEGKFAVLLPVEHMDKVIDELSSIPVKINEVATINADMCFGFISMDNKEKNLDYYYERALIALSEAKKGIGGNVCEYTERMEELAHRRQLILSEMHNAIKEKQFFVEFQPQVSLKTGKVCGAEALARWKHPTLGRLPSDEFIPLFEDNGFITKMDIFIWEEAAAAIVKMRERGTYMGPVSVNVSQLDIKNTNVVETLSRIVRVNGLSPKDIHVEITESACASDRESLIRTMFGLREKGFLLEIDDFGSGYSSLNALMHMPFDVIKLDMAFMVDDTSTENGQVIVNAMAKMIHDLKASIIVEGVETTRNVETALKFEGDIAQGHYFSKPLVRPRFEEYVLRLEGEPALPVKS